MRNFFKIILYLFVCFMGFASNVSAEEIDNNESNIAGLDLYATVDFNNINFTASFSPADV